jgi:DNA-directed RNA polymerase subunit RPC12/RpoP
MGNYMCSRCGSAEFAIDSHYNPKKLEEQLDVFCRNCNSHQGLLQQAIRILKLAA